MTRKKYYNSHTKSQDIDVSIYKSGIGYSIRCIDNQGYPTHYHKDVPIEGLAGIGSLEDVTVFHGGTKRSGAGELVTAGGRILGVTARGESLEKALARCYDSVAQIKWEGMQYRRDIGQFRKPASRTST